MYHRMTSSIKRTNLLKHYYLLSSNAVAEKISLDGSSYEKTLFIGTLVFVDRIIDEDKVALKVVDFEKNNINEDDLWVCQLKYLLRVDKKLWPLIQTINQRRIRVSILENRKLCEELLSIEVGSDVYYSDSGDFADCRNAIVQYRGPIHLMGQGTYFGIEILDGKEFDCQGHNDGSFAGSKYFSCRPGRGKFVSVDKLRLRTSKIPKNSMQNLKETTVMQCKDTFENVSRNNFQIESPKNDGSGFGSGMRTPDLPLKVGDRVVYVTDIQNLYGVVRYILHDGRVHVEFVDMREDIPDYDSPKNMSKTFDPMELVKVEDFFNGSDSRRPKQRTKSEGSCSGYQGNCSSFRETPCQLRCSDMFQYNNFNCDKATTSKGVCSNGEEFKRINNCFNPPDIMPTKINHNFSGEFSSIASPPSDRFEDGSVTSSDCNYYDSPEPGMLDSDSDSELVVGSLVEVLIDKESYYGLIRWIGTISGSPQKLAGIEMEDENPNFGNGTFRSQQYFHCNPNRSHFTFLSNCRKDSRFLDCPMNIEEIKKKEFGMIDCPAVPGIRQPITLDKDVESICGKNKGIQGHHNSCYLDATLFSMFTFTSVFDSLLFRPATGNDILRYDEVQKVLREEIVNPLRDNLFVRADKVMKLRTLLEELSSVSGLTSEEKDPEEFLTSLVTQILRAEPFLQFNTGQEANHYQLFVEKDEKLTFPTVQQLFEQSFLSSDIKLKRVPSCLIIQMPRFGKTFKMYPRILPSLLLDVTDVIENSPRQCTVCGDLARFECKQCYNQCDEGLQSISFCEICLGKVHSHQDRSNHKWRPVRVPAEFCSALPGPGHSQLIPRLFMELFAVVCIETSHYVAFVKCGPGNEAPWCFFDSMADRKGEQNGYNIPEMVPCPNLPDWLSEKGAHHSTKDDRQLPEHEKRLLCDAYMCMYQSAEVMMYR